MFWPKSSIRFLAPTFILLLTGFPALADSKARVVRLSEVEGKVEIARAGQDYEKAFANLPISEGEKIRATNEGRASLEFEDNSALRLTPGSEIEISKLSLRDSGAKVSSIKLVDGVIYLNFLGAKDDEFTVNFVREKLTLTHAAHLRITLGDADAAVAVFSGDVQVVGPSGAVSVAKNQTAKFNLVDDTYKLAKNVGSDPFDGWDKQQDQYQQRYADNAYSSYSPYAYGTPDLNYYGSWYNLPGYGQMWQPYFSGAGWDPYMNGSWTLFPGVGYGWVSAYPWGWTPYNYGSWNYLPLYGWMWAPGGAWMGGYPLPLYANAPLGFESPHVPLLPGKRVIAVNKASGSTFSDGFFNRIQVPNNSAGLGIPRGGVQNLGQMSQMALEHGSATSRLHVEPVGIGSGWGRGGGYGRSQMAGWGPGWNDFGRHNDGRALEWRPRRRRWWRGASLSE